MPGELWAIAQDYMDKHGVRAATLARRMGTSPTTIDSWKHRGVRAVPARHLLDALARETNTPYLVVLDAALTDVGYLPAEAPQLTVAEWYEVAARLRTDPVRPLSEREVVQVLGPRPAEPQAGELGGVTGGVTAGETPDTRRMLG